MQFFDPTSHGWSTPQGTCIARNKTCRIGTPSTTPRRTPPASRTPAATDVTVPAGTHAFEAIALDTFLESQPPQLPVYLRHDSDDDMCEAYLNEILAFYIVPVIEFYTQHYGSEGSFFYRIISKTSGDSLEFFRVRQDL